MTAPNFAPHSEANEAANPPSFAAKFRASPLAALFVVVALIAVFAYAISAWQVYGFARYVWAVPVLLCFASSVIADLLSLAGLFATYLLRNAKWTVRAYAWFVFLLMTGLSIAAAESYAHWRALDPVAQQVATQRGGFSSQVASGAVVVALALSVHLLIVVRRHANVSLPPPPAPRRQPAPRAPVAPQLAAVGFTPNPPAAPPAPKKPGRRQQRRSDDQERRVAAVASVKNGKRPAEVAQELNVSRRTVEIWVQKAKQVESAPAIAAVPTIPIPAKPQVNGHDIRTPVEEEVN